MSQATVDQVRTIASLKASYTEDTEAFLDEFKGLVRQVLSSKTAAETAKTNLVLAGLHTGVAADYWMENRLSATPGWCGKDFAKDYLPAQLGLKPGEKLPPQIVKNGQVVLALVFPGKSEKPQLTEVEYLSLRQSAINAIWKMLEHFKFDALVASRNEYFAEAIKAAKARQEGYQKVLAGLAEEICGKTDGKENGTNVSELLAGVPLYELVGAVEFVKNELANPDRRKLINEKRMKSAIHGLLEIMDVMEMVIDRKTVVEMTKTYVQPDYLVKLSEKIAAADEAARVAAEMTNETSAHISHELAVAKLAAAEKLVNENFANEGRATSLAECQAAADKVTEDVAGFLAEEAESRLMAGQAAAA